MSTKVADLLRKAVQAASKAGPLTPPLMPETEDELAQHESEATRLDTADRPNRLSPTYP